MFKELYIFTPVTLDARFRSLKHTGFTFDFLFTDAATAALTPALGVIELTAFGPGWIIHTKSL